MNNDTVAGLRARSRHARASIIRRSLAVALVVFGLCLAPGSTLAASPAFPVHRSAISLGKNAKASAKGKKSKPKRKAKGGKKRKKPSGGKKPPAKKKEKKGGAPKYTLTAMPKRVGPVPPPRCARLLVRTFYEIPVGPKKTRQIPYHPGASTQTVLLSTTFGHLSPTKTTLTSAGTAKATVCSKKPGIAVVTVKVPSFVSRQFAKQCKQTNGKLCKRSKPKAPVTATVIFFGGKGGEPKGKEPGAGPGGSPVNGGVGSGTGGDAPPVAVFGFSPAVAKAGATVSFDGSGSYDPDGTLTGWSWGFGAPLYGGGIANTVSGGGGPTPSTSFTAPGVYPVTLTVTDNAGLRDSVTHDVKVSGPGEKVGDFATEPTQPGGCSGTITAFVAIYIPHYAEAEKYTIGTATGGCAGATLKVTHVERIAHGAPPDNEGKPRLDAWGEVKDAYRIEFTLEGGGTSEGAIPFTASWS